MRYLLQRLESLHTLDVANARKPSSILTLFEKNKNQ